MESTQPDSPATPAPPAWRRPELWGLLTATSDGWDLLGPVGTADSSRDAEILGTLLGRTFATSSCAVRRGSAADLAAALAAVVPGSPYVAPLRRLSATGPNVLAVFVDALDDPVTSDADATLRRIAAETLGIRVAPPVREDVRPVE